MQDKKTLLIVDDDIAHRTMLRILLDWQYEISEADDGSMATEIVSKQNFDMILMDNRMPGVSGMEALGRIRSMKPDVPIVLMTAYFSVEIAGQAIRKGAFDCLSKPFDFDKLRHTIERAIASVEPRQRATI